MIFEETIKKIEGDDIPAVAIYKHLQHLMNNLQTSNQHNYFPLQVKAEMENLKKENYDLKHFEVVAKQFRSKYFILHLNFRFLIFYRLQCVNQLIVTNILRHTLNSLLI